jgi:outer membrane protein TolC
MFARQQSGVRLLSLEQARVVLNNNRTRQRVGDMTRADVLQAESVVAQREGDYYNAMLNVKDAEDALWFQIESTADSWDVGLVPTDHPTLEVVPYSTQQLVAVALQSRPDLIASLHRLAVDELDRRVAQNAILPELNLTASGGFQGLGGEPSSSLSLLGTLDFEDWVVGITLRHPLQNRAARAQLRQAELSLVQSETNLQALRLQITLDVRNAMRRVQNALDLLAAREAEVRARELDLHDETRRFEYGLSTTDTLLDFQDDLASARINQLGAIIEYEQAIIALEQATGRLLERWGVVIEPAEGQAG